MATSIKKRSAKSIMNELISLVGEDLKGDKELASKVVNGLVRVMGDITDKQLEEMIDIAYKDKSDMCA